MRRGLMAAKWACRSRQTDTNLEGECPHGHARFRPDDFHASLSVIEYSCRVGRGRLDDHDLQRRYRQPFRQVLSTNLSPATESAFPLNTLWQRIDFGVNCRGSLRAWPFVMDGN